MFGGMLSDKASTAKLLASGSASVDTVLGRLDLPDHINNNCNVGANLRYFLQFTEKNLPRILNAVQKPAGGVGGSATSTPSTRFLDGNDSNSNTLLAARNAAALLVKYCQCCEKKSNTNTFSANSASGNAIDAAAAAAANAPSPLGKVVPVMIGVFCRRGELPDSVALDVQRILLASIETDHETTLHNINLTLRSDIVTGVVRHLSTSMIVSETLVSLFGSALNAKAMMMEVSDPSAFVVKWVEHDFHLRLVNHLNSAMKNVECAPYFFFFQEMLKRAFSPNVGPMVDQILSEQCFGKLFDIAVSAAEDLLNVRKKRGSNNKDSSNNNKDDTHRSPSATSSASSSAAELVEGETAPITHIGTVVNGSVVRTLSGASANTTSHHNATDDDEPEYPYLAEALNLVFQCVGIIRRSLPPPESEPIYMSRRLPLSHGPVHVMLRYLPRLVNILRSAVPSKFRPSSYIVRRHRSVVEKLRQRNNTSQTHSENGDAVSNGNMNGASIAGKRAHLFSHSLDTNSNLNDDEDDTVRIDDGGDESDSTTASAAANGEKKKPSSNNNSKDAPFSATSVPPSTIFGTARLAITDIIVELTLFRSRVCDEALVASGAIEALLDCAEVYANHDLLLRNVHRVIMAVMQRPAYSDISLASNVTAAIAASEAAQKSMAQHAGAGGGGGVTGNAHGGDKNSHNNNGGNAFSSNLSFASSTFENGKDSHPSFMGLDDLRRQYSSSSISMDGDHEEGEEGEDSLGEDGMGSSCFGNTVTSLDDELLFHGGKTLVARKGQGGAALTVSGKKFNNECGAICDDKKQKKGEYDEDTAAAEADDASFTDATANNNSNAKDKKRRATTRKHPHLLRKNLREALEAEKLIERQILQRLDRETLAMVHVDPLVRFLIQKRPLTELLYAWAATPESMSEEEQAMMPEGQRAFRDFSNTSLQVHATQIIQRLKEVGASQSVKNECGETLHCNDEISSKLALWQKPITGERFTEKGSGCLETIVHRPTVYHRDPENSLLNDDDDDDDDEYEFGISDGSSSNKSAHNTSSDGTLDFDAGNLISGRSRASNNNDTSRYTPESPEKKRTAGGTSTDDFLNEDVTGEAAPLKSPRKRSNSMGREGRYASAAAYEDDDVSNTSGGLFTDDMFGVAPGILKDVELNDDSSAAGASPSSAIHRDPFANIGPAAGASSSSGDNFASPVVTRPRSRNSAPPEHVPSAADVSVADPSRPVEVEAFDESAFETRELVDQSNMATATSDGEGQTKPASPPHYDRYLNDVPEFKPSKSVTGFDDSSDDDDEDDKKKNKNGDKDPSPPSSRPAAASETAAASSSSSSKFKVTFASGASRAQQRAGSASQPPRHASVSPTNQQGTDDSFEELDEDAIGVIEKTRGVSVDSSVDSDTADMLFERNQQHNDDDDEEEGAEKQQEQPKQEEEGNGDEENEEEAPEPIDEVAGNLSEEQAAPEEAEKEEKTQNGVVVQAAASADNKNAQVLDEPAVADEAENNEDALESAAIVDANEVGEIAVAEPQEENGVENSAESTAEKDESSVGPTTVAATHDDKDEATDDATTAAASDAIDVDNKETTAETLEANTKPAAVGSMVVPEEEDSEDSGEDGSEKKNHDEDDGI